jgi:hypothetical protein
LSACNPRADIRTRIIFDGAHQWPSREDKAANRARAHSSPCLPVCPSPRCRLDHNAKKSPLIVSSQASSKKLRTNPFPGSSGPITRWQSAVTRVRAELPNRHDGTWGFLPGHMQMCQVLYSRTTFASSSNGLLGKPLTLATEGCRARELRRADVTIALGRPQSPRARSQPEPELRRHLKSIDARAEPFCYTIGTVVPEANASSGQDILSQ